MLKNEKQVLLYDPDYRTISSIIVVVCFEHEFFFGDEKSKLVKILMNELLIWFVKYNTYLNYRISDITHVLIIIHWKKNEKQVNFPGMKIMIH